MSNATRIVERKNKNHSARRQRIQRERAAKRSAAQFAPEVLAKMEPIPPRGVGRSLGGARRKAS